MLEFIVLSENHSNGDMEGEFGLSLAVKFDGYKFLFDTGASNLFSINAKKMGFSVDMFENVIFSHGHSDHSGGVVYIKEPKRIIAHPNIFKARYSIRQGKFVGFPTDEDSLRSVHNLFKTKNPVQINPGIWFLGEIPMVVDFEKNGNFATTLDGAFKQIDMTEDDSAVVFDTPKGLVIMAGCCHRGVCNIIEYAKKVTGKTRVSTIIGGLHLRNLETKKELIDNTIEYMKSNGIGNFYLGHCITDEVIDYFEKNMPNAKIFRLAVGKKFNVDRRIETNLVERLNNN